MRIKAASITTDNENLELSKQTWPTVQAYCLSKGISCSRSMLNTGNLTRHASWYKIKAILAAMYEADYVMWVDSDAIVLNDKLDVKELIDPDKLLHISKDVNGINCGVMIWKSCEVSRKILREAWFQDDLIDHQWWDQAAIMRLYNGNFNDLQSQTKFIDQKVFNAYDYSLYNIDYPEGQYDMSSFVFHVPGLPIETRISTIKRVLDEKNRHSKGNS